MQVARSLAIGRLPTDSADAFDLIKVRILAENVQGMLSRQGGDPEIVFRDRTAFSCETVTNCGVHVCRFSIGWQDDRLRLEQFKSRFTTVRLTPE